MPLSWEADATGAVSAVVVAEMQDVVGSVELLAVSEEAEAEEETTEEVAAKPTFIKSFMPAG